MTMRQSHLSDDRLIDLCLDRWAPETEQRHLASCLACEARRARMAELLSDVSAVAAAQADAVFSPEQLSTQRAHILQRIEHETRHARVITFPAPHAHASSLRARPGMRWIAGAAAAGLIIGLMAGHLAHRAPGATASPLPAIDLAGADDDSLEFVAVSLSEEEFLGQMEMAVEGTGGSALGPLDVLTPRVWEVAAP